MSEAPEQKKLDIPSGRIPAGGEMYHLTYSLSTTRYVEYLKKLPKLTFNVTFAGMYDTLSKIYMVSSAGNDMIYAVQQARELSWNQLEAIKRFDENEVIDVIDFCALFINKSNEDISKFNQALHDEKCLALQNEGYDTEDFFLLTAKLIQNFPDAYRKILSHISEGQPVKNTTTPQTNSIS